ncbi:hypothetical protein ACT7DD_15190 [Bacillus paranthracis]
MFHLSTGELDWLFIKVGMVSIFLITLMAILVFYKMNQIDKEYEERAKQREIQFAERRLELKKKKEESLEELKKKARRKKQLENEKGLVKRSGFHLFISTRIPGIANPQQKDCSHIGSTNCF